MKVFIVFFALLMINLTFIIYQGDMGKYMQSQKFMKALAEESAAGAALYFDEMHYGLGQYVFQYEEGKKYVDFLLKKSSEKMPFQKNAKLAYEISFEDDILGYKKEDIPSVTVEITAETDDIFRLPFIEVTCIKRIAKYECKTINH